MIDETALINPVLRQERTVAIGTVTGVYTDGITVKLDGDTAAGQKHYKRLAGYSSPVVGHRVLVIFVGGSFVVAGNIV